MPDNTFDIASKIDMNEVLNAVQQTSKELLTRYDLKDSKSSVELNEKDHKLLGEFRRVQTQSRHRNPGPKTSQAECPLERPHLRPIANRLRRSVRQEISLQTGIPMEKAKDIIKLIKDSKVKVQASIQGDVVRVSGKDRDTLQASNRPASKTKDFGIDMQFTNYRSN